MNTSLYSHQIARLFRDKETDNCPLILDILSAIDLDTRLVSYLFGIAVFHADRYLSERALSLLEQRASKQTAQKAAKLRGTLTHSYEEVEFLSRHKTEEVDLFHLLLASKMCLWHRYRPEMGSNAEVAFRTLDLRRLKYPHLSSSLTDLDFLTFLALPAHKDFDLQSAVSLLVQMPLLETIVLENIRIEQFPIELFSLPRLTALIIRRGHMRYRAPIVVPEGGPYGSSSLKRLVCESYPIAGAQRLGPFPNLQEASLPRCGLTTLCFLRDSFFLEYLNARHNSLEYVPDFLGALTRLRTLDLGHNPFKTIALNLSQMEQLEVLDLSIVRSQ